MTLDAPPVNPRSSVRPAWLLAVLALLATAIAAYLAWVHWGQRGLPVGCGDNGGCAEVLNSRWSTLAGIPVGVIGIPIYLWVAWLALHRPSRGTSWGLAFAASVLVSAAAWFMFLQAGLLGAFCPWCVAEHILGLVIATLAVGHARRIAERPSRLRGPISGGILGTLSVIVLAALQFVTPTAATTVRLTGDPAAAASSSGKSVTLLQGQLHIIPSEEPVLGDPAAANRLYLMFDYCCPHCRRTHEYLLDALEKHAGRMNVVCLPMPRDSDCNPAIARTEARFEHACELARLALAVWQVKPEAFAEFDHWLFEPRRPPSPEAARAKAEELMTSETLQKALTAAEGQQKIARNVRAFNDSQVGYLPVMMAPGMDTIVGRPESREAVMATVEQELLGRSE